MVSPAVQPVAAPPGLSGGRRIMGGMSETIPKPGTTLTAADPEPPAGTLVRDDCGAVWVNDGYRPCCWVQPDADVHDPESWTKIAGNYGPVTVMGVIE